MRLKFSEKTTASVLIGLGLLASAIAVALLTVPQLRSIAAEFWSARKNVAVRPGWDETIIRASIDSFLFGAALIAGGGALANSNVVSRRVEQRHLRLATASLLGVGIQLCVFWFRNSYLHGNTRIWFLHDDAMISMRYGMNLASGAGLVWNVGEHVEGYTNFLWTCVMAAIHVAGVRSEHAAFFVLLFNIVIFVALVAAVDRLAVRLGASGAMAFAALLLCVLSRDLIRWSSSGLESLSLALLVTMALPGVLTQTPRRVDTALTQTALAMLALMRSDAIVLDLLLIAVAFVVRVQRRRLLAYAAFAVAPASAHLAFRLLYYGAWLPNTALLKVTGSTHLVEHGLNYVGHFLVSYLLVCTALIASFWRLETRTRTGLALLLAGLVAYVIYVGGDAFEGYRFLVPVVPLVFVLATLGIQSHFRGAHARVFGCAALIVATPLLLQNRWLSAAPAFATSLVPSYGDVGNAEIGLWLRDNTPDNASVADYWAGSVFYFSGRRGVDLLGKTDATIARMPARCQAGLPGHNKYDFSYSLGRLRPDYVVAGFKLDEAGTLSGPSGEPIPGDKPDDPCAIFAALARDETFRRLYLPHVAINRFWRTVFSNTPGIIPTR